MGTSRGENTALIMCFHYNHLFSVIQTKLIQAKNSKSKVCPKKFARSGRIFFGLSSDLQFFLNKIFFPIIKINRLPSITMEAQAVARQHLARWKCVSIRFEFLALIMVVMLLVGSRVYFR